MHAVRPSEESGDVGCEPVIEIVEVGWGHWGDGSITRGPNGWLDNTTSSKVLSMLSCSGTVAMECAIIGRLDHLQSQSLSLSPSPTSHTSFSALADSSKTKDRGVLRWHVIIGGRKPVVGNGGAVAAKKKKDQTQ